MGELAVGSYQLNPHVKVMGSIQNVFDDEYIVWRHPYGARPHKPLTALISVEIKF
jgi:outer membrane receptor protein involved in Fe transport